MAITFIFDVIIIPKTVYSFKLIIIFFFFLFKKYPDICNYIILNYIFFFSLIIFSFSIFFLFLFLFSFKMCPRVSNYSIHIYSAIMLLFLSFPFFCFKRCPNNINYFDFYFISNYFWFLSHHILRARSLVVSDLRSETKDSRLKSGC